MRAVRDDSGERDGWWIGDNFISSADMARLRALRRRVNKARDFPTNTCGASRHLHMIAEALATGRPYPMLIEEPAHCAETMLAVLASLWELRTKSPEYAKELEAELAAIRSSHEESTSR